MIWKNKQGQYPLSDQSDSQFYEFKMAADLGGLFGSEDWWPFWNHIISHDLVHKEVMALNFLKTMLFDILFLHTCPKNVFPHRLHIASIKRNHHGILDILISVRFWGFLTKCAYKFTDTHTYTISYPPCKKGIRPGICVKPAVSHEARGRVRYDWLNADTRPYPFFTRRITNLSSAPPPPNASQHTCIVGNGQISQWDLMGKINIMQSGDKKYVHLYTT